MKQKRIRNFSDLVGEVVQKYRILELLERGAFGEVYICEHVDSRKRYAMKVPFASKHESNHWKYLAEFTFQREVFILQQFLKYETQWSLRHNGLPIVQDVLSVTIYPNYPLSPTKESKSDSSNRESGEDPGAPTPEKKKRKRRQSRLTEELPLVLSVIVIDLLGPSLSDIFWSRNLKPFPVSTVCKIALQMLKSFEFIHRHGLVHSDIKPSNLLVGGRMWRKIYVIDFGMTENYVSKDGDHVELGKGKGFLGTTLYSGVNAMSGNMPSRKDDMQSIGYVLHYLCTGTINWKNECEMMKLKSTTTPSSSSSSTQNMIIPSISSKEELKAIVLEKKKKFVEYLRNESTIIPPILKYFEAIEKLKYKSTPPYAKLKSIFEQYLAKKRPKTWRRELYNLPWEDKEQRKLKKVESLLAEGKRKKKNNEETEGEEEEEELDLGTVLREVEEELERTSDGEEYYTEDIFKEFKNRGRSKELDSSSVLFSKFEKLQLPNSMPFFVI